MTRSRYGSDVVVDALRDLGIPYVALNPGASFRGIHDSLVNRTDGPGMLLCPHEKIAINIAHGFAKATGRPMAAIVHDVVGLLHGSLGLFYAFTDRCPMLVLGGAGPADTARRRPEIDWIHTANVQAEAVRAYVKWDDQPASIAAIPQSMLRAYRVATLQPAGPVYVAIDADLQEQATTVMESLADARAEAPLISTDADALGLVAARLVAASHPVIVTGYVGRDPRSFDVVPDLADILAAGIIDLGIRLSVPSAHPLNLSGTDVLDEADLILLLDVKDHSRPLTQTDPATRGIERRAPAARLIAIGFGDLHASSWVQHQGAAVSLDTEVLADAAAVLPQLVECCRAMVEQESQADRTERLARRERLHGLHLSTRDAWVREAASHSDDVPVAPAWLAAEVAEALDGFDWVLAAGTLNGWATRLWELDRPYRHPGKSLGTATQVGISLGVALAHRGLGRVVVGLQPDGDLLYDASSLWVASANRLPLLLVMYNNRAYYNDWNHQLLVAATRGSPPDRAALGVGIEEPPVDFAGLARSFGWWAEGPVTSPDAVRGSVRRAVESVAREDRPALVDVLCAHR